VAVYGTVFANRLGYWLPRSVPRHLLGHLSPAVLQASPGTIHTLPPAVRDGVAQVVAHSVATVFLIATPIAALGFLVVLFLREYPLRTRGQDGAGPQSHAARSGAEAEQVSAAHQEAEQVSAAHQEAEQVSAAPTTPSSGVQRPQAAAVPASARRSIQQS
jgi:hypothetical protein